MAQGLFQTRDFSSKDRDRLGRELLEAAKSCQQDGSRTKVFVRFDREA